MWNEDNLSPCSQCTQVPHSLTHTCLQDFQVQKGYWLPVAFCDLVQESWLEGTQ